MAEQFSYERDVAPLMGNYFKRLQSSGLSPLAQAKLYEAKTQEAQAGFANEAAARTKAMEFEKTRLALDDVRSKSLQARGDMQSLGALQSILDDALTSTPREQHREVVAGLRVKLAPLIESNEMAKSMFNSVQKSFTSSKSSATDDSTKHADKIFEGLGSVELAVDDANRPIDEFKDEGSRGKVMRVITQFATDEEKAKAAEAPASVQLKIARDAQTRWDVSKLQGQSGQPQTQSPRSLYGKSPTPP